MNHIAKVFCDGGVIGPNPSALGGTWACCLIDHDDLLIAEESGVIIPAQAMLPTVTNNLTELLAAVRAIELLPQGWVGQILTDSNVTRCRLVSAEAGMAGVPDWLRERLTGARGRLGPGCEIILLDGHPTKAQLEAGYGKRGNPVSKWNVRCDKKCGELAMAFKERLRMA